MADNWAEHLIDEKSFAFETGHAFRGITITQKETGYNIVIRASSPKGEPVYAMTWAEDPIEGLRAIWRIISHASGATSWHRDKYASGSR